jgi:hypothetical protein
MHNDVAHCCNWHQLPHGGIPIKIAGLPTFQTLKELKQDLEANAASVSSSLGGGHHGYLGALLDAQTYAIFVRNDATGALQLFIILTWWCSETTAQDENDMSST